MIFIETENLNLNVPSKDNLVQWSEWVNSANVRKTVLSTLIPKTKEMQCFLIFRIKKQERRRNTMVWGPKTSQN